MLMMVSSAIGQETAPQFDQPVKAELYVIRPGDELVVTFLKANIESLKLTVDPEGNIIESKLGMFDLSNKTLVEAREILIESLKNLYKIENIVISIAEPLPVRVSVSGAVHSPGYYQGYTSQRVTEAVQKAGGILRDGSSRRIMFSGGPRELYADLDLVVYTGSNEANPCLYAGYNIHVPQRSNNRIQVIGEVNDPREIELIEGDQLLRLIELAGGFRSWADRTKIEIIRNGSTFDAYTKQIQSGDIINVKAQTDIPELTKVTLFGAIERAGRYDCSSSLSLRGLIEKAGGYQEQAVVARTTVFRLNPVDASGRISTQRFPIQNVYLDNNSAGEFMLSPGDSVFVPYFVGFVQVAGYVTNPGLYPFHSDKAAEYYVNLAGGYLPESERTDIEIYDAISKITSLFSPKVNVHDGSKIIVGKRREIK